MDNGSGGQGNYGVVSAVRGSVVDVRFASHLPPLKNQLRMGEMESVVLEVAAHVSADTVRGIALTPTQGLSRGEVVRDTGGPLRVTVVFL